MPGTSVIQAPGSDQLRLPPEQPALSELFVPVGDVIQTAQSLPTNSLSHDVALIRRAMKGLVYGAPLERLMARPVLPNVETPTPWSVKIDPFYYLSDFGEPKIRGNCIELSYYLAHRLAALSRDAQLSEPYTFAAVRGRFSNYFENAEHIFLLGWKTREDAVAREIISDCVARRCPLRSKHLIILDATFRSVCATRARGNYRVDSTTFLFDTSALKPHFEDFCLLTIYQGCPRSQSIPLGFLRKLVPPTHFPAGLSRRTLLWFSIEPETGGLLRSCLEIQETPSSTLVPWGPGQGDFIEGLPTYNGLRRFVQHVNQSLASPRALRP